MIIFKTRHFSHWQKKSQLSDEVLREAIGDIELGLVEAELGGGLFKKRIARKGQGKRSGYRTIIAGKKGEHWFFLYGFAKNERDNIDNDELLALKALAEELLSMDKDKRSLAVQNGALQEIKDEK